ncbi:MAG: sulfatase [Planctomycetaceae bacterium]|nr:sulfatase [Planctomycetaceae bacterium]|tara:strand:- start:891 stop:2327 length:1437 start_codon:yes stop_codon:yes gene_type:complete
MNLIDQHNQAITRRHFFGKSSVGIGTAALASLLNENATAADLSGISHFAPKAKRVIYLFQNGAPTHVDLFDHKPDMQQYRGTDLPDSIQQGQRLTTMTQGKARKVLPTPWKFRPYGESGTYMSELVPHMGSIADDLCLVRSMYSEAINHAPAITFLLTGSEMPGRPSMGAWLSYGLGSDNQDLPTFCAMTSRDKEASCGQIFYEWYWGAGFLPTHHQGVKFRGTGDPVLYLSNPKGIDRGLRKQLLDQLSKFNQIKQQEVGDPEILTRISQYEMAYRMQASVPELADITTEPQHILDLYGPDVTRRGSFAQNCLLARRLAEQGVRFIQLMHAGWDQHNNLPTQLAVQARDTDQPAAGLVKDLKQRGLLDDTLVIWGGEFGRTPFVQGDMNNQKQHGRDHHPYCFSLWMAGGGIKGGSTYGQSDDFCYNVAENGVHVHDLQATILHLLGIDHERLTYRFQGRQFRLTDVHGKIVKPILA